MGEDKFGLYTNEYLCLGDDETRQLEELDHRVCNFLERFQPVHITIPAMIDGEILKTCGYFDKSPNQLSAVAVGDRNAYPKIVEDKEIKKDSSVVTNYYLTPAACLQIYPILGRMQPQEPICFTMKSNVFRYEGGEHDGVGHLWNFTVREAVFCGEEPLVRKRLEEMERFILDYASGLCSDVKVVPAFDHFYLGDVSPAMKKFQISNRLKRELVLPMGDKELALGSFNYHGTHFSKTYHFDQGGNIVTGCVGFGMERWLEFFKRIKGEA